MNITKNGITISIDDNEVVRIALAKLNGDHAEPRVGVIPKIGTVINGATFMGVVRGDGEAPDHLLWDLGEAPERMNWKEALAWAESQGGGLPTRREQSVMFGNRAEGQYKDEWYWSCEQCAGDDDYAWIQGFGNGYQLYGHKGNVYRARAVRREPIQ